MTEAYRLCRESADYITGRVTIKPEIGLILGSALGMLADQIENRQIVDYADIPNFLRSTAPGHAGKLIFGQLAGKNVVCMSGRFHSYEGYSFQQLTIPIRVLKLLGVRLTILTNAAGGVNENFRPGDVMIIRDHIMLSGHNPMRGENAGEFGPRFFDVTNMYDRRLREIARDCLSRSSMRMQEGVYFFWQGPSFETPAEIRAIRVLGGDAVGMSTVTEALTAAHCGMPVLAMSLITNMAAGILPKPISGEEVDEVGMSYGKPFGDVMKDIIAHV